MQAHVPIAILERDHLPCTATAVQEMSMQHGSLTTKHRLEGPDVWQFRWSEKGPHGKRIYRKRVIGTLKEYPDAEAARHVVAGLITEVNWANPLYGWVLRRNGLRPPVLSCP